MARIAIVGTGLIGGSWAALFLAHGHDVVATDPAPGAEERLRANVADAWPVLTQPGLADGATPDRLTFVADIESAVEDADFVQESGPEQIELKRAIGRRMEAAAPVGTVLASSTSGLLISDIQRDAAHPERFLVGHPFNPPHLMPLVEVVAGPATSAAAVQEAVATYRAMGRSPIVLQRELPGHIANRLQVAVLREAFALVASGAATAADVDTAMIDGPGLRWALFGPFLSGESGGGAGGIRHFLQHLGPAFRDWSTDLSAYPDDDALIPAAVAGVGAELDGRDFAEMQRRRDESIVRVLALRRAAGLEVGVEVTASER